MGQYKLPSPQTEAESCTRPAAEMRNRAEPLNRRQRTYRLMQGVTVEDYTEATNIQMHT